MAFRATARSTADRLLSHLNEDYLLGVCFMKPYRWTDTSNLVVRGVGRTALAPFTLFGFEVLVDVQRPGDPAASRFLRGFVKYSSSAPASAEPAP